MALSMFRGTGRVLLVLVAVSFLLGSLASSASAAAAKAEPVRVEGGEADFGAGAHALGGPGFGKIRWDLTPSGNVTNVTGRVQGVLYLDKLGEGCARVKIQYEAEAGAVLALRTRSFCGPGFNANSSQNQLAIDESFTSPQLFRVFIFVGSGSSAGTIQDHQGGGGTIPRPSKGFIVNNGTADFGGTHGIHVAGSPVHNPAGMSLEVSDGRASGGVSGMLFWDSTSSGCARLTIDYQSAPGVNLATRQFTVCGPFGGNALAGTNRRLVQDDFSHPALFKIRVRVGTVVNGAFVGAVNSTTLSFAT